MQEVQKGFQELNKVDNIEADTQLKKHQAWKLREDVRLMTHDLIIKNETNRIKNQANEVERLKAEITKYVNELYKPTLVKSLTRNARSKAEAFDWGSIKNSWQRILKS